LNTEKESIGEVVYDKDNSEFCSNSKRAIIYDEIGEHIIGFGQLNYRDFDFLSLVNPPYRWKKSKFF
jgi:hypothetical protein